jgi:hypothetical protein
LTYKGETTMIAILEQINGLLNPEGTIRIASAITISGEVTLWGNGVLRNQGVIWGD